MKRYLEVPYKENQEAKSLGARWDPEVRKWYIPETRDTEEFKRWLPNTREVAVGVPAADKPGTTDRVGIKDKDSPSYDRFKKWWEWWNENLPVVEYQDHIGSFIRIGAVVVDRSSVRD